MRNEGACGRLLGIGQRTDAEEEEGKQGDGVTAQPPAQRAGRRRLLCRLHGGVLVVDVAELKPWMGSKVSRVSSLLRLRYAT